MPAACSASRLRATVSLPRYRPSAMQEHWASYSASFSRRFCRHRAVSEWGSAPQRARLTAPSWRARAPKHETRRACCSVAAGGLSLGRLPRVNAGMESDNAGRGRPAGRGRDGSGSAHSTGSPPLGWAAIAVRVRVPVDRGCHHRRSPGPAARDRDVTPSGHTRHAGSPAAHAATQFPGRPELSLPAWRERPLDSLRGRPARGSPFWRPWAAAVCTTASGCPAAAPGPGA